MALAESSRTIERKPGHISPPKKRLWLSSATHLYKGELADFSDYDLLVDFINPMPVLELGHAVQTDDLSFVFDRAQLDFIHEL